MNNGFYKKEDTTTDKYKASDDYVKPRLFDMYFDAHRLFADHNLVRSFRLLAGIFTIIYNREFTLKDKLYEDTRQMMKYFNSLGNKTTKLNEIIEIGRRQETLENLFLDYLFEIGICLDELGVLLKTNQVFNDLHKDLSMQNFGDELSLYNENKKELKKNLDTDKLLNYLTPNMIYRIYALWRYDNALQSRHDID